MTWYSAKEEQHPLPERGTLVWLAWTNGEVSITRVREDAKVASISFDRNVNITHWAYAVPPAHPTSSLAKG